MKTICKTFLLAVLSVSVASAQAPTPNSIAVEPSKKDDFKFEVVSVRPVSGLPTVFGPGFTQSGFDGWVSLRSMIMAAYAPEDFPAWVNPDGATRLSNPPSWVDEQFQIKARVAEGDIEAWRNDGPTHELYKSALRDILKDRFKLVLHTEPREITGYHLVTKGKSFKLKETPAGFVFPPGRPLKGGGVAGAAGGKSRGWHYYGATMENLAAALSLTTGLPVEDRTGLTGHYDFLFEPTVDPLPDAVDPVDRWPIEQLGLALKPGKVHGRTLIIDHIEKADPN